MASLNLRHFGEVALVGVMAKAMFAALARLFGLAYAMLWQHPNRK